LGRAIFFLKTKPSYKLLFGSLLVKAIATQQKLPGIAPGPVHFRNPTALKYSPSSFHRITASLWLRVYRLTEGENIMTGDGEIEEIHPLFKELLSRPTDEIFEILLRIHGKEELRRMMLEVERGRDSGER
jgi:hypothetical protein